MSRYNVEYHVDFTYENVNTEEIKVITEEGSDTFDFDDDEIQELIDDEDEFDYVECKEDALDALVNKEWDESMESDWVELPEEDFSDEWDCRDICLEIDKIEEE